MTVRCDSAVNTNRFVETHRAGAVGGCLAALLKAVQQLAWLLLTCCCLMLLACRCTLTTVAAGCLTLKHSALIAHVAWDVQACALAALAWLLAGPCCFVLLLASLLAAWRLDCPSLLR